MQPGTPNIVITEEMIDAAVGIFIDYDADKIDMEEAARGIFERMLAAS